MHSLYIHAMHAHSLCSYAKFWLDATDRGPSQASWNDKSGSALQSKFAPAPSPVNNEIWGADIIEITEFVAQCHMKCWTWAAEVRGAAAGMLTEG